MTATEPRDGEVEEVARSVNEKLPYADDDWNDVEPKRRVLCLAIAGAAIATIDRLRSPTPDAVGELVEALETIRTECDPGFAPFADPEDGRANIFAIANAALASHTTLGKG